MPWIVAQTKPRQEIFAEAELKKYGFGVYCPLARFTVRHAGKINHRVEPLFSRYLFVADSNQSAALRRIRYISDVLMQGDRFARVSDAVIDAIRARETNGAVDINPPVRSSPGCSVRVTAGPMEGMMAIYQRQRGEDRAIVLLRVLGERREVAINSCALEPA